MKIGGQLSAARKKVIFGYGAATICLWSIGFSAAAVQAMKAAVPDLLLAAFRYATQAIGVSIILLCKGQFPPAFEQRHIPLLIAVTVSNSVYNLGLFAGASILPLVDAVGITNTAAMVFIASVRCIAKQPIGLVKIFAILLAILGIFMMMQPGWIFGKEDFNNAPMEDCLQPSVTNDVIRNTSINTNVSIDGCPLKNNTKIEMQKHIMGSVYTVFAGIGIGINYILISDFLGDLNALHIPLCTGVLGTIVCLTTSLYVEDITLPMTSIRSSTCLLLLVHSVCASIDNVLTVVAVSLIGSLESSIVFSLEVIVFMCLQYSLMSSYIPGHKNWLEVMGAIVNCIGALLPPAIDLTVAYMYVNPSINDF